MEKEKLNNGIMNGKRGIVMGVANDRSIAWGIAEAVAKQGAEIAFTCLLYTSPSPRDLSTSRMPSSA